jgi:hypothetical protein
MSYKGLFDYWGTMHKAWPAGPGITCGFKQKECSMSRKLRTVALLLVLVLTVGVLAGCYGSFTLTKKLYDWNGTVGDKAVNSAVMWVLLIVPAYEACGFIDFVVLNTIEFYTGKNPMAMRAGEEKSQIVMAGDIPYQVVATRERFDIYGYSDTEWNRIGSYCYREKEGAFFLEAGGESHRLAYWNRENPSLMSIILPDGRLDSVNLDACGPFASE